MKELSSSKFYHSCEVISLYYGDSSISSAASLWLGGGECLAHGAERLRAPSIAFTDRLKQSTVTHLQQQDGILVRTDGSYVNTVIVPESDHTAAAAPQRRTR